MMSSTNPNTPVNEDDLWYHGKICREEAETLLLEDGKEGTFLVRDSSINPGSYTLSVLVDNGIHHLQISRHGEDAFFSLAEEYTVIHHGLDELIRVYQSPSNDRNLLLGRPVVKHAPPPECRRHGRTNLLHRATREGNLKVVKSLLESGSRSIDAKNEDGQTAAHLAAIHGHSEVMKVLINANAYVDCKDSSGQTPLHYACANNHCDTARVLLTLGERKANPQIRRGADGWVPLHEAASKGYSACVKLLLDSGAPLYPRTKTDKTPVQLAVEKCHNETIAEIRKFRRPPYSTNRDDWYHSVLGRKDAVDLLLQCQEANDDRAKCYFLVRRSSRPGADRHYVLTTLYYGSAKNFEIMSKVMKEGHWFYIDDGPYLESLEAVIDHYSRWTDGLPCVLQVPVRPTQSFANHRHTTVSSPDVEPPPLPKRTPMRSQNGRRMNSVPTLELQNNLNDTVNRDVFEANRPESFSKDNIPQENIELIEPIGEGEYGDVYKGTFTDAENNIIHVAVKTLKEELSAASQNELLREGRIMMDLEHENIVRFIGISWQPKFWMVQELMELGSLETYLRDNRSSIDATTDIPRWAYQVTAGLEYLDQKGVVHRDLAVRNILLKDRLTAKISDFGLSRVFRTGKDYYEAEHGGRWPIKWYAPECCFRGTFTHKSDIWSFGITLWEMYSYGDVPYGVGVQGQQVIEMVDQGYRLECPQDCPKDVYDQMRQCWEEEPEKRPCSSELNKFFMKKVCFETLC